MSLKRYTSMTMVLFLLAASFAGCGSQEVMEVSEPDRTARQEKRQELAEIPEADMEALLQAALDAAAEESDLWAISKITDKEVLMQLTQFNTGRKRPAEGNGEQPEAMTLPDETVKQQPDAERLGPGGGKFPENRTGNLPKNSQPGNRGGRMPGFALVLSGTEAATLSAEDILTQIRRTAEELGYQASSVELTEDQQAFLDVAEGYSVKMIVLIHTEMPGTLFK